MNRSHAQIAAGGPLRRHGAAAASLAAFYGGWFIAAESARRGQPAWAVAPLWLFVLGHAAPLSHKARALALCAAVGLAGAALDVGLIRYAVFTLPGSPPTWEVFLWLTGLWALMAATLTGCLSWMRGRLLAAAVLGAIGGPLSYAAAARYGALDLSTPPSWSFGVFALEWGSVTPLLAALSVRFVPLAKLETPATSPTGDEANA